MKHVDDKFGLCPFDAADKLEQWNVDQSNFFVCQQHRIYWRVGRNLLSSWQDENEAIWARNAELLAQMTEVESTRCQCDECRSRRVGTVVFDSVLTILRESGRKPYLGDRCEAYFRVTLPSYVPHEFIFYVGEMPVDMPWTVVAAVREHYGGEGRVGKIVERVDDRTADVADFLRLLAADMEERLREDKEREARQAELPF